MSHRVVFCGVPPLLSTAAGASSPLRSRWRVSIGSGAAASLIASSVSSSLSTSNAFSESKRFWSKPKRRPKVGTGFHEKAQKWRDEYLLDRHRVLADSLRAYVDFSSTRRSEPWDTRFAPFDRNEKDGVHVLVRHLMEEKLQLCSYHHRPVKRLCCNVGLMGPQVTTRARWKPSRYATTPANTTKAERIFQCDKNVQTGYNHD